jgi:adenosylcobinamide-GDP ribazoletransferase
MKQTKEGILYGLSYFTILPFKVKNFEANKSFYKGVLFSLPLSGLILGLFCMIFFLVLPFHSIYSAFLSSIFYIFLYGMLHLEAVGDTIDGYFASLSKKDIYAVMHEPQIGALGAIGAFTFLLLKISAIAYLLYLNEFIILILSLILSRLSVWFALELNYHKKSSFVLSLKENNLNNKVINILFFPLRISTKYILEKLQKKLGFLNGDTLGFVIVINEILLLNIGLLIC